jgi:hypothetical protein
MKVPFKIYRASSVKEELKSRYVVKEADPHLFYSLLGSYQSRFLGLCIIRSEDELEDLQGELRVWFQGDKRRAEEMIKQFPEIFSFDGDQD